MSEHESVNHWKREILRFIYKVDKLKGKNKFPTAEQLYSWTYGKVQDITTDPITAPNRLSNICNEYGCELTMSNQRFLDKVDYICEGYFR